VPDKIPLQGVLAPLRLSVLAALLWFYKKPKVEEQKMNEEIGSGANIKILPEALRHLKNPTGTGACERPSAGANVPVT
jgi:hypothetical protein